MKKLSDRVSVPAQVMDRSVGDETVILDLESGTYYGLDPVGARMWQLLGEGKSLGEVCEIMLEEYDVARERLEEDLLKLAEELANNGLVDRA
jgi:hypothetical protein